mmetsp:Transcript_72676/g.195874  ORF Transcript_72676/g.195874 Transcript_72676/m.195874 type:complete len:98 (-) Transcript_72676:11-304(-)
MNLVRRFAMQASCEALRYRSVRLAAIQERKPCCANPSVMLLRAASDRVRTHNAHPEMGLRVPGPSLASEEMPLKPAVCANKGLTEKKLRRVPDRLEL